MVCVSLSCFGKRIISLHHYAILFQSFPPYATTYILGKFVCSQQQEFCSSFCEQLVPLLKKTVVGLWEGLWIFFPKGRGAENSIWRGKKRALLWCNNLDMRTIHNHDKPKMHDWKKNRFSPFLRDEKDNPAVSAWGETRPGRNNGRNFSGIRALTAVKISHRSRY